MQAKSDNNQDGFDSLGNIHGVWYIQEKYKGGIYNGVNALIVFNANHGLLDSTYKVYSKKNQTLLEEGRFKVNNNQIKGDAKTIDSIKHQILVLAVQNTYRKYYRKTGYPFDETINYSDNGHIYIYYYPDSYNIWSKHFQFANLDSMVVYTNNGQLQSYETRKDSLIIKTIIIHSNN